MFHDSYRMFNCHFWYLQKGRSDKRRPADIVGLANRIDMCTNQPSHQASCRLKSNDIMLGKKQSECNELYKMYTHFLARFLKAISECTYKPDNNRGS